MSHRGKPQRSKRMRKLPPDKMHICEPLKPQRPSNHRCKATGKMSWKTEFDALLVLGRTRRRVGHREGAGHKAEKRAYKCEHGDHWHLTARSTWNPEEWESSSASA